LIVAWHVVLMLVGIVGGFATFGYWLYLADPKNNRPRSLRSFGLTLTLIIVWTVAYLIGRTLW